MCWIRWGTLKTLACGGIASAVLLLGSNVFKNAVANSDTRTISFHHVHLNEDLTVTFKVNGRFVPQALKKINWELRDWRTNKPITMDPHLIDCLWEVYQEVGARGPIYVIGGFRSPATNAMLRRRSSGVAKFSQHMRGKAIDFYIPGISLREIRNAALRLHQGGVGFYPTSGSPFVHMDTGNVRHWPRIPEVQLARIMSERPHTRLASNRSAPPTHAPDNSQIAAATTPPATGAEVAALIPIPQARPAVKPTAQPGGFQLASTSSRPVVLPGSRAASLVSRATASANDVISQRGYWKGRVEPNRRLADARVAALEEQEPQSPEASSGSQAAQSIATGSLVPWPMPERRGSGPALAYAPAAAPMDTRDASMERSPAAQANTTVQRKLHQSRGVDSKPARAKIPDKLNDPWMRAMIVSPDARGYMSTTLLGAPDFLKLAPELHKPASAVMMTFSADPYFGLSAKAFTGRAVVFVATVTFNRQTASLR